MTTNKLQRKRRRGREGEREEERREGRRKKAHYKSSLELINPVSFQATSKDRLVIAGNEERYKRVQSYLEILGLFCQMANKKDAAYDPLKTQGKHSETERRYLGL